MPITTVLFDLDGTLLPMDQEVFVRTYLRLLAKKMAPLGYDPQRLTEAIWKGTAAVVKNDGVQTNEQVFWQVFRSLFGEAMMRDMPVFEAFYRNEFQQVAEVCGKNPAAAELIGNLQKRGLRLVLATNPLFPAVATHSRIRWAGLEPGDFALVTTYENSRRCKPDPDYYRDILEELGLTAEECVMVGNDACEDLAAAQAGLPVFLLTDCLICKPGCDISRVPHGGFGDLRSWLDGLMER